jgi:E3 ubiquitin-protein ligase BIG BROTHER-like protein
MATPTTYSVEEWLTSDEALAWQLQEEENTRVAAADTREFAGTVHSQNLFASLEVIPLATEL